MIHDFNNKKLFEFYHIEPEYTSLHKKNHGDMSILMANCMVCAANKQR